MQPSILKTLADNPALFDEVKKVILAQFALEGRITDTDTNEVLGQQLRSYLEGRNKVEEAFRIIAQYKSPPAQPEPFNRAR